jgi:hypothetical protein
VVKRLPVAQANGLVDAIGFNWNLRPLGRDAYALVGREAAESSDSRFHWVIVWLEFSIGQPDT